MGVQREGKREFDGRLRLRLTLNGSDLLSIALLSLL